MRDNERQRLIGILKDGLENGGPVQGQGIVKSPLSDYTSPELLAQERKVFFRETPLFMGLSADLPENGSYWADSEAGLPILMTRDDEGRFPRIRQHLQAPGCAGCTGRPGHAGPVQLPVPRMDLR